MEQTDIIPVVVAGATGRLGCEIVRTVLAQADMTLVGALGHARHLCCDIGEVLTGESCGIAVETDADQVLLKAKGGVLVIVSVGESVVEYALKAIECGVAVVIGSTGLAKEAEDRICALSNKSRVPVLFAPNFALGAVLMMKFAKMAARYFEWGEIIEMHHERKLDAPSGTAKRTAELMVRASKNGFRSAPEGNEHLKGVRGGKLCGVNIHSVRMPGFLANQEVILGGTGETLHIRHETISRESFMGGVMLAIRKVRSLNGAVVGLENVLDD